MPSNITVIQLDLMLAKSQPTKLNYKDHENSQLTYS